MTARDLRDLLSDKMFRPFRLRLSDGSEHTIWRRDQCTVSRSYIAFGVVDHPDNAESPDRIRRVALRHVTQLEPLEPAA